MHVVFKGQIAPGVDAETVKEKLANLFKVNLAQAEAMLSGKPVYIKKNVDLATAKKYQAAMQKAGAVANIIPVEQATAKPEATAAQTQAKPPITKAAPAAGIALPGSTATIAIPDTDAPKTTVKIDTSSTDISAISMAETGTALQDTQEEIPMPEVDIADLSLAAAGEGELSHNNDVPPLQIDTSGLSID